MRAVAPRSLALPELLGSLASLDATGGDLEIHTGSGRPAPSLRVGVASLRATRRARSLRTTITGADTAPVEELQPITDLRAARRQADAAADQFEREAPAAPPSVVRAVRFVFEELGANVVQHSGAPATGFGCVAPTPEGFELALADRGVGFRASLQRHPKLAGRIQDDAEAIQLAVEKGLSSLGGRTNMGMGLGVLCDLSDRLGGELWIASGEALWHRRTAPHGLRVATVRAVPSYSGALVCLRAPLAPVPAAAAP